MVVEAKFGKIVPAVKSVGHLTSRCKHIWGNTEPEAVSRPAIYLLEGKLIEPTSALVVLLKPQELKNLVVEEDP
jgi:hypothetical protein